MTTPFNVMATYWLSRDRLYRVYSDAEALYFIRIGGQFAYKDVRTQPPLGVAAYAVQSALAAAERILAPADIAALDRKPPRELFGQDRHDLAIPLASVDSSVVTPPRIGLNGRHCGRWLLTRKGGKRLTLQFMEIEQMKIALTVLPTVLQGQMQINGCWDPERNSFVAAC